MKLAAEPLTDQHDAAAFSCGNQDLDRWLIAHALHARGQGTRTFVLADSPSRSVLGYFAIAPHLVRRADLAPSFSRGMPRVIPAILLAKLALDRSMQGQGLGTELLVSALRTIATAARIAGGKLVLVDAIDEDAARFYVEHGFTPLPGDDHRLVHKLSTVARELEIEWP